MKVLLILGGIGILAWLILAPSNATATTATAPSAPGQTPGGTKWRGVPPASPNLTVTQPGTDQNNQGSNIQFLAPVRSLRYYQ